MGRTVTIATLARELGLSQSAVSKALNDYPDIGPDTKKLVLSKAEEMGYSPNMMARNLAKKTSNFIGVVIRDVSSIYGEMFKSLNTVSWHHGLNLILYDTGNNLDTERRCIQNLIDTMAMGIIVAPVSEDVAQIRRMTRGRVPVVYLGGKVRVDSVNYVCTDSVSGTEIAMRHLIGLGHRKIVMLCDHKMSDSRSRKISTYRKLMAEVGEEGRILHSDGSAGDLTEAGYRLCRQMIDSGERFTAVFAVKDMLAIGALGALKDAGVRVPEEVSVVGYDGIDAAGLPLIGLTTVAQPRQEMAEAIMDILLRHAEEPSLAPEHFLAKPELMLRSSTRAR